MFVPETNDPYEKLKWAQLLIERQSRPIPAERLINQAIAICKQNNDYSCLGRAYILYWEFFRSSLIDIFQKNYKESGFIDKSATYDNRLIKSDECFEKAIFYYNEIQDYGALASAYFNLGHYYHFIGDYKAECEPYSKSLEYNIKLLTAKPNVKIMIPNGFSSYKEFIEDQQKRAGCL
jgi:tetratricopeptide (TPR) repeat protein